MEYTVGVKAPKQIGEYYIEDHLGNYIYLEGGPVLMWLIKDGVEAISYIVDMKTTNALWVEMTNEIDRNTVKNKTFEGAKYKARMYYDGSGFEYWIQDENFRFNLYISFEKHNACYNDTDIENMDAGIYEVLEKAQEIIDRYISQINELNPGLEIELL